MFRFVILFERDRPPGGEGSGVWWVKAIAIGLSAVGIAGLIMWRLLTR